MSDSDVQNEIDQMVIALIQKHPALFQSRGDVLAFALTAEVAGFVWSDGRLTQGVPVNTDSGLGAYVEEDAETSYEGTGLGGYDDTDEAEDSATQETEEESTWSYFDFIDSFADGAEFPPVMAEVLEAQADALQDVVESAAERADNFEFVVQGSRTVEPGSPLRNMPDELTPVWQEIVEWYLSQ